MKVLFYLKSLLKYQISLEKPNIRYWMIFLFAVGILTGFLSENNTKIIIFLSSIVICSFFVLIFEKKRKIILKTLFFFIFGLIIAVFKVYSTGDIKTNFGTNDVVFNGIISEIRLTSNCSYLTITAINPPNTELKGRKVKLKYNGDATKISVGDIVRIKTSLSTIKYNTFPNDKSYENYAKYFDIVARGRIKELSIINNHNNKIAISIDKIRKNIQTRIFDVNNGSVGSGIVIDILTGNNSFIPRDKLNNIRRSGCAHILAISGLHMSIIVAIVFVLFLHIFACFPKIALKYNTKKLASIPACLTCFIYLQVANVPISALRSFIMISIGFIALLSNRPKTSMNILFITFFTILCITPQYILSPSFQMSFMAVFCLVSVYNSEFLTQSNRFSIKNKTIRYIVGILSSSIIATIATTFFEIYHFKQYAWIGLISNIAVIPITEFVVLPLGFIGMIFNGNFIGDFFYKISALFADIVCKITDFTANLPNSYILTPKMELWQLGLIIFGLFVIFLSYAWLLKIIGIISVIFGITYYILQPKVLLVYNKNLQNIVFLEDDKYYSVEPIKNDYLHYVWSQNLGVKEILPMTDKNKAIICKYDYNNKKNNNKKTIKSCEYYYLGKKYSFNKKNSNKIISVSSIK